VSELIQHSNFVHLHVHTHYSLLDGANRIDELIASVKDMAMPAVAITDHGNMFGAIEFYKTAKAAGVKPIMGMEAYIAPGDRRHKEPVKGNGETNYHLLLLAMNLTGYKNLLKLASIGYLEGFYYKPRIDRETLAAHSEGLICTSTCLGAEIPQALVHHDRAAAEDIADWYLKTFGPERFYIELQDHGIEDQRMINPELVEIAQRKGVGLIVTNDVHYLRHEDVEAHDVLCCISTRALLSDTDRFKFPTDQFFLKTPEQMAGLFPKYPEAMANTLSIAERCNVEFDFKKRYTPVYRPPDQKSAEDYLRELVYTGAQERYGQISDELRERIDYELQVISSKGFSSYFLICWDFVHYARSRGIPCGARGSGCSSVVAFCLHLSQPDPLLYGLYFERFMDPDRDEMPDIDIDICQDGREEVIAYVREKYGHVAQIITFGTLKAKAAIRDVCRVFGVPLADADRIAKLVPEELKMTLEKAVAQEPELGRLYREDPQVRKVIDIGKRIEGLARHAGVHAAGVVIADEPLDGLLPLYKATGSDATITQFEGPTVEAVGLLKMDFLGLRTLSVLALACKLIEQNHGTKVDLEHLNLKDAKVYQLFERGETRGLFQFESGGMRDVVMKMRPNRIEDLIAANALYRPGPMAYIESYISRKHGERWSTPHKIMDDVLAETYGIIVYQEQVARLVHQLGGIERKRAFRLAKAISKKKTSMIEAERAPFIEGAAKHGVSKSTAEEIFNKIIPFGEYAFNKAHSTGYSLVAFQTGYLKTYYPLEYMAALLTYEMGDTDKVVEYIEECKRLGIDVRAPDINSSNADFTTVRESNDKGFLRFGLAAIKGVGVKAVASIAQARTEGGPFHDLFDFCERIDLTIVNRGVIEALIKAGAFDTTGAMRKSLVLSLDNAMQVAAQTRKDKESGQLNMFDALGGAGPTERPKLATGEWSEAEMLAHEKSVLGFYVTSHPLAREGRIMARFASAQCSEARQMGEGAELVLGGMISRLRMMTTKTGKNAGSKMAILTFEDLSGSIEAVVYSEDLEKHRDLIGPDQLVYLRGRLDRRREEPNLKVSDVYSLEEGPMRLATSAIVRLGATGINPGLLQSLKEICASRRGSVPLFLEVRSPNAIVAMIRCGPEMAVRPDGEFQSAIEALLGADSLRILGVGTTRSAPEPMPPSQDIEEAAVESDADLITV
jgi:DNA polymerase-3 subunit alpha